MTIDYAKKQPSRRSPGQRRWLALILSVAIIAAIPALLFMHYVHMPHFHHKPTVIHKNRKPVAPTQLSLEQPQNQYDFYSMLPKMQVKVSNQNPNIASLNPNQPYYLLQVATSTDEQAAENLVTKLGVMGLNADVKKLSNGAITHYEIIVGPYTSTQNARTDQAYLHTNHYDSILLKINNYPKH